MLNRHTPSGLKVRDVPFDIKAVGDDGRFEGYGSVFGVVDSYNEVVEPGAFSESLAAHRSAGRPVPVLWQHQWTQPIGLYEELAEDDTGLRVVGRLLKDDVRQAQEAHALMKAGVISGLSIGYVTRDDSYDEATRVRRLKKLDLWEVSPVTFPANSDARIDAVKLALVQGRVPNTRDLEAFLREAGASRSLAAAIASRATAGLQRESEAEAKTIAGGLRDLAHLAGPLKLPKL